MRARSSLVRVAVLLLIALLGLAVATPTMTNTTVTVTIPANTPTPVTVMCDSGYHATACAGVSQTAPGIPIPSNIRPAESFQSGRNCTARFTQPFAYTANQWNLIAMTSCVENE